MVLNSKTMLYVSVGAYMISSSLMLIMNKLTIDFFPRPLLLLLFQTSFVMIVLNILSDYKYIKLTEFSMDVLKRFWIVPVAFLMTLFCNTQILKHTNVETFFVLRASTPFVLLILDVHFLGRRLPSMQSWCSVIGVFAFACCYVYYENAELTSDSLFWLFGWYVVFCFEQIYTKYIIDTVIMTTWDRVMYSNTIIVLILIPAVLILEDSINVNDPYVFVFIFVTCVIGVPMSYFAFTVRQSVPATTFTVVDNVSKLITEVGLS